MTTEETRQEAMERMNQEIKEKNAQVRDRDKCYVCGDDVPVDDYRAKYAGAGGVLQGPFCSPECYWGFLDGAESAEVYQND